MYNGILAGLHRAFVFSTYMDSLCITNRAHSFLSHTGTCVQCGSDVRLRALYLKFDNLEKIDFFWFR